MTRHLRAVETPLRWGRLETRAEIDAWAADRRRVLSALVAAEGLAQEREPAREQLQLHLGVAA